MERMKAVDGLAAKKRLRNTVSETASGHTAGDMLVANVSADPAGRSLAGVAGSNPPDAWMSVSCEHYVLYRERPLRRTDPSSRGVLPNVCVCVSICVIRCNSNPLHPQLVGTRDANNKSASYTFDVEKLLLSKPRRHPGEVEVWFHSYVTSSVYPSERSNSRAGCFTPGTGTY
jgi:hypothetical protein